MKLPRFLTKYRRTPSLFTVTMSALCLLLFVIPLAAIPWLHEHHFDWKYTPNTCEALAAAWGTLLASLIVGFLIFSFQRRIETTKFIQTTSDNISRIMSDHTAWILVPPTDGGQTPVACPVDFRYAVGKQKWDVDPTSMVCDKTDKHTVKEFHNDAHLSLKDREEFKIQYPGLIYKMTPTLLLASKSLHELYHQMWVLMEALDSGLITNDDLLTFWRPLDIFLPSYDRFAQGRKITYEEFLQTESGASRWMEFFLFGNKFDEPVNNPKYGTFIGMATAMKRANMYRVHTTVVKRVK